MFELVGRRLNIACILTEDTPKARRVYTRRKKFKLLEELLDCRVEIRIAAPRRCEWLPKISERWIYSIRSSTA